MINLDKRILDCEGNPTTLTHKGVRELEALKQNPKLEFPETVKTVVKAALRSVHSTNQNWLDEGRIEHGLTRMYGESEIPDNYFTKEERELIRRKLVDYTLTSDDGKESGYFPPHITFQVLEELKLLK
jgi:protein involved in sex pheromone biosynthesis